MNNREYIQRMQRIPPALVAWLQRATDTEGNHLFNWSVAGVPLVPRASWPYGTPCKAVAKGRTIYIQATYLLNCSVGPLLARLAHELVHIEEYNRQGWLSHALEWVRDYWRSRWDPMYLSYDCPEERQALERQHQMFEFLSLHPGWENLLEAPV